MSSFIRASNISNILKGGKIFVSNKKLLKEIEQIKIKIFNAFRLKEF